VDSLSPAGTETTTMQTTPSTNLHPSCSLFTCNSLQDAVCNLQNMVTIPAIVSKEKSLYPLTASSAHTLPFILFYYYYFKKL
jgi:hypothetical protein